MLPTLLVTLREGIEAFLIVAITLAYLRKSGRAALAPAVYWGTGTALVLSVVAGYWFGEAENKPLWEGILAAAAAVMVMSMVVYMLKAAKHLRSDIAAREGSEAGKRAEHQPPLRPDAPYPATSASSTAIRSDGSASAR